MSSTLAKFNHKRYRLEQNDMLIEDTSQGDMTSDDYADLMSELARYVEDSLIQDFKFSAIQMPDSDENNIDPVTTILASPNWTEKEDLLIICINQSGSQLGIFSRSMCLDGGLNKGTVFPYVKRALENNYGVLILRPNTNTDKSKVPIIGSESPELHALCVWENVVPMAADNVKRIMLFGYGNGSALCHEMYLKSRVANQAELSDIVKAVVTVEASHVIEKDDPVDVVDSLTKIAVNFEASTHFARGFDLRYRKNRLGCKSFSLGLPSGDLDITNVAVSASLAVNDVFSFLSLAQECSVDSLMTQYTSTSCRRHGLAMQGSFADAAPVEEVEEEVESGEEDKATPEPKKAGVFSWMFGASPSSTSEDSSSTTRSLKVDDFDLLKIVGKGAFGKVMLVQKKAGFNAGKVYAMKVLKKSDVIDKGQVAHTNAEQAILCAIAHPFIVRLRFSFQNEDKLYLITDYYSGGNLFAHLRKEQRFKAPRAKFYAAELLLALDHLHSNDIIYRDLKLENILMDGQGHICLTDFGLSKQDIDKGGGASTFCGTAEYLAPELLQGKVYGKEVDWWSFGILLYEMMHGRTPFYDKNRKAMYTRICKTKPHYSEKIFDGDSQEVIGALLESKAANRMSNADAIQNTSFFATIDFEKLYNREIMPPFQPTGAHEMALDYVPKQFKDLDPNRDSSARSEPAKNPQQAAQMATAFADFSFSEQDRKGR